MPKEFIAKLAGSWSDYYSLDTVVVHKLQYVKLKSAGIEIIAQKYRAQYGFDITVDKYYGFGSGATANFLAKLNLQLDSLQEGGIKGMIFNFTTPNGDLAHSTPYIATRLDGQIIIVDFEKKFNLNKLGFNIRQAKGEYVGLQADLVSCGVFAVNVIKNCLKDREFLAQLHDGTVAIKANSGIKAERKIQFEDESDFSVEESDEEKKEENELEIVNLKKVMGQRTKIIKILSQEQKDKYVHELQNMCDLGQLKKFNLKAFYKGHDYARIINPDHLDLLNQDSRSMVLKIDEIRREIKSKKPTIKKESFRDEASEEFDLEDVLEGVNFDDVDFPDLEGIPKKSTAIDKSETSRLLDDGKSSFAPKK